MSAVTPIVLGNSYTLAGNFSIPVVFNMTTLANGQMGWTQAGTEVPAGDRVLKPDVQTVSDQISLVDVDLIDAANSSVPSTSKTYNNLVAANEGAEFWAVDSALNEARMELANVTGLNSALPTDASVQPTDVSLATELHQVAQILVDDRGSLASPVGAAPVADQIDVLQTAAAQLENNGSPTSATAIQQAPARGYLVNIAA